MTDIFKIPVTHYDYTIGVQPYNPGEPNVYSHNRPQIMPTIKPAPFLMVGGGVQGVPQLRAAPAELTDNAPFMPDYFKLSGILRKS